TSAHSPYTCLCTSPCRRCRPTRRSSDLKLVGVAEDEPRLNFNGPLIADRLYLSQSLAYAIIKNPVRGLSFPFNETKTEMRGRAQIGRSTRLNSSHLGISYAVFCLKKKKN